MLPPPVFKKIRAKGFIRYWMHARREAEAMLADALMEATAAGEGEAGD